MRAGLLSILFLISCFQVHASDLVCEISGNELREISGMAFSRSHPGVFWVHNDSDDGPYLYAVSFSGDMLGKFEVKGGTSVDWEDMSSGPCPDNGKECFFIGDIGDNSGTRNKLSVLVIEVPQAASGGELSVKKIISFGGQGMNFESLAWVPARKSFFLIEKKGKRFGGQPKKPAIYSLNLSGEFRYLNDLALSSHATSSEDTLVTSADFNEGNGKLLVGTYGKVFILNSNLEVENVHDLPELKKAEAFAWGNGGIFVTGEDKSPTLWRITAEGRR